MSAIMTPPKTHRPAHVSIEAAKLLQARGYTVDGPIFDAAAPGCCTVDVRPPRKRRYTEDDDGTVAPMELAHRGVDKTEARLAPIDGKVATKTNRDFDGLFARLREADQRLTAKEAGQPATQGGLNHASPQPQQQPNQGAAISPTASPGASGPDAKGEMPAPTKRSPYSGRPISYSGVDPDAPEGEREAQIAAFKKTPEGQMTNDAISPLEKARAVLQKGLLEPASKAAIEKEAKRITDRAAEFEANKLALHLKG